VKKKSSSFANETLGKKMIFSLSLFLSRIVIKKSVEKNNTGEIKGRDNERRNFVSEKSMSASTSILYVGKHS